MTLAMELQRQKMEGHKEGENLFAALVSALLADGRMQDVERAAKDEAYRKKLFEEFHMNGEDGVR